MEISPIGAVSEDAAFRMSTLEMARQAVVAARTPQEPQQQSTAAVNPLSAGEVRFSPAIYARAAEYQIYTQAGTPALLMAQQMVTPPTNPVVTKDALPIRAVEGPSSGASVDTMA